jgi:hypothetical protein
MGLQHPEEADVDAARCRGYLLGKAATERLAALDVKDARAAGYTAGLLAGLEWAYSQDTLCCHVYGTPTDAVSKAIAHVKASGALPEDDAT